MARVGRIMVGVAVLGLLGGCRASTQVTEVARVDLQLENVGNRGYLVGTPPAPRELNATRQMLELTVELPSFFPGKHAEGIGLEGLAPPEIETEQVEVPESWTGPEQYDTYVVQKNDSLWAIAAKPEIYGKATQWRGIFDANRDVLRTPTDLKAGMKLRIPRGEGGAAEGAVPATK